MQIDSGFVSGFQGLRKLWKKCVWAEKFNGRRIAIDFDPTVCFSRLTSSTEGNFQHKTISIVYLNEITWVWLFSLFFVCLSLRCLEGILCPWTLFCLILKRIISNKNLLKHWLTKLRGVEFITLQEIVNTKGLEVRWA